MKLLIETNAGVFAAYLTATGEISIYQGDDETTIASILPIVKRKPVIDYSGEGIAKSVRTWLETTYGRMEIESITVRLTP